MTWLAWRQIRAQAAASALALAALALLLVFSAARGAHLGGDLIQALRPTQRHAYIAGRRNPDPAAGGHRGVLGRAAGRARARGRHLPAGLDANRKPGTLAVDEDRSQRTRHAGHRCLCDTPDWLVERADRSRNRDRAGIEADCTLPASSRSPSTRAGSSRAPTRSSRSYSASPSVC